MTQETLSPLLTALFAAGAALQVAGAGLEIAALRRSARLRDRLITLTCYRLDELCEAGRDESRGIHARVGEVFSPVACGEPHPVTGTITFGKGRQVNLKIEVTYGYQNPIKNSDEEVPVLQSVRGTENGQVFNIEPAGLPGFLESWKERVTGASVSNGKPAPV